jgi:hypothetical protein
MTLGLAMAPATELDAYARPSRLSERTLMRGYRPAVVRREPCACGTELVQRAGEAVEDVVARHNAELAHEAWSAQARVS